MQLDAIYNEVLQKKTNCKLQDALHLFNNHCKVRYQVSAFAITTCETYVCLHILYFTRSTDNGVKY